MDVEGKNRSTPKSVATTKVETNGDKGGKQNDANDKDKDKNKIKEKGNLIQMEKEMEKETEKEREKEREEKEDHLELSDNLNSLDNLDDFSSEDNSFSSDGEIYETNLKELIESETMSWIFVGGKGGVGKTTTSCCLAVELAKRRKSVLLLSTDPAHNTSDAFNQKFTNKPTLVKSFSNLYCMEVDASFTESTEFKLQKNEILQNILCDVVQSFPGIDEAFCFAELMMAVKHMDYSVIVFDTAPTGHTLRLLSFPELIKKALNYAMNLREKLKGPFNVLQTMTKGETDFEAFYDKISNMSSLAANIQDKFQNEKETTFVCVCIPEFLSVYETERLIQELIKKNISCFNIVVNQVIFPLQSEEPDLKECLDFINQMDNDSKQKNCFQKLLNRSKELKIVYNSRRKMQSKYLVQIKSLYEKDFHIVCLPQMKTEITGVECIRQFSKNLLNPSVDQNLILMGESEKEELD